MKIVVFTPTIPKTLGKIGKLKEIINSLILRMNYQSLHYIYIRKRLNTLYVSNIYKIFHMKIYVEENFK